jgi:NAD(P)-dependent dehydrogenase (short-subunit alcohol dehydrogenase family)
MDQAPKTAFVTGAGRGIGRGIAWALAERGFAVAVNDVRESDDLEATIAGVTARGTRAVAVPGDISDLAQHAHLVDTVWTELGGCDCLVNNAGVSVETRGDLLNVTPGSFDRLMGTNLRGPFFLTQAMIRRMLPVSSTHFRSIVTISSLNAEAASPDRAEYCISKAGLSMMSKVLAARLGDAGIRVYEVRPGVIRTAMTAVVKDKYDARFAAGAAPIARWGEPEDVGRTVAALAEGALAYTTGEVVHVDGGWSLFRL